jgi:uncharacterized repeat protein (TIGR01451 family)
MIRRALLLAASALASLAALSPAIATATPQVAWKLRLDSYPTSFPAGKQARYLLVASNVGAATATGPITFTDTLPPGLKPLGAEGEANDPGAGPISCSPPAGQTVSCETPGPIHAGFSPSVEIRLQVEAPEPSMLSDEAEVSGGGASAKASTTTTIAAAPPPFGFVGFDAPALDEEGGPATEAGSHPYNQLTELYFPTTEPGEKLLTGAGHLRDVTVDLPRGESADPAASPVLCTEAELITETSPGCPAPSAVGLVTAATGIGSLVAKSAPLYAMVPPPGAPAVFGFDALGVGIFIHVTGSVRSDSDYGLSGSVNDVLARSLNPVFGAGVEFWGDPSAAAHEASRGNCVDTVGPPCPATPQQTAFLTLPTQCPGEPSLYRSRVDSWEEPSPPFEEHEAQYESADLEGNPASLDGCNKLAFEPTIEAKTTSDVADSPSGLEFDLRQPQQTALGAPSTAALRDTTITFPKGLAVNASQAAGLGACSEQQIGFQGEEEGRLDFSKSPQQCPDAAKLGRIEVTSPLLVQRNAAHKVEIDPGTGAPVPEPLEGSLYIAKPFQNPFGSLVAVYLVIEDAKTGIVAKLAGEAQLDPQTGQITTRFEENPELPLEDIKAKLFGGPRGAFLTPPTCGTYTTSADLTPWSAPEGATATATDAFRLRSAPGGGSCPREATRMPNAPALSAGTLLPSAGKYSPLIFKLSREDGSQRLGEIEATLPPGLSAKLAGVSECSEAEIAKAKARERPEQGALEQADPSCPAASEVGTVNAAAGAGPTPYRAQGHAYLAGPYKGAPLSFVVITPAVAGPFDLGVVVSRIAVYLDPTTAQGRAVSDPLPQLLDGIPLDLRSVSLNMSRPSFTFNPTSCDVLSFSGSATSALGAVAPLSERFQAAGCASLPYKPKYHVRLFGPTHRGGHPRLRVIFEAKPGEANTARIVFALPHSEFIDQGHFRTICTRVQFAANQCPAGSIYGHITATSPQVDYRLEGPIYLRSSSHELPDVVAVLKGPPSQPVEVDLDGRVDSVNGGVRTSFETVPDASVTKAVVSLQGGKKGLFENSTNICKGANRATLKLNGQNGKTYDTKPLLRAECGKGAKKKHGGHKR